MARQQFYGIKYPFSNESEDKYYMDLNESYIQGVQSELFHLLFTPKGQKLRDPGFGCDLIQFIFAPNDELTMSSIKEEINSSIEKYVPGVQVNEINVMSEEGEDASKIVDVNYSVKIGNKKYNKTVAIKL